MYFPKSQVKTGLIATQESRLRVRTTNQPYIGPYWETATGLYFSGTSPADNNTYQLVKHTEGDIDSGDPGFGVLIDASSDLTYYVDDSMYRQLATNQSDPPARGPRLPVYNATMPTAADYSLGEFRRFFCKKGTSITYLEITEHTYNRLVSRDPNILWYDYVPFILFWKLTGDKEQVYNVNRNLVQGLELKNNLPKLAQFLKNDYLKYYKG